MEDSDRSFDFALQLVDEPVSGERAVGSEPEQPERTRLVPAVGKPWEGLEIVRDEVVMDPIEVDLEILGRKYFVDTQLQCARIIDTDEVYDLHHMSADLARRFVVDKIENGPKLEHGTLYFVTGRGSHSDDGTPVLSATIDGMLNTMAKEGRVFAYFTVKGVRTHEVSAFIVKLYGSKYKPGVR